MKALQSLALAVALGALLTSYASGCARGGEASTRGQTSGDTVSDAPPGTPVGNLENGRRVFGDNCATCHGATGREGGVGPSLQDERARKDYDATIAWIENPQPPMPKLYPSPMSRQAVDDVAAYVQSL
jgi:mono/diheme cytochrome c family protein